MIQISLFRTAACLLAALSLPALSAAAELELKSLGALAEGAKPKRKMGPYVSVMAGETLGQTGTARVGSRAFPVEDIDGSAMFSVEVGRTWDMRRVPVEFSL